MRMLMQVKLPLQPFNSYVQDGSIGEKMNQILQATKPESVYFTEFDGRRGAVMIIQMDSPSKVPMFAEPWFLLFNADVQFHIVMSPEDQPVEELVTLFRLGNERRKIEIMACEEEIKKYEQLLTVLLTT